MHRNNIFQLMFLFWVIVGIQVRGVHAEQNLCETADININFLNAILLNSCADRESDGFDANSYCVANERVSVFGTDGEIGFPFARDIVSPIPVGQRIINGAFSSGFGWGVVAYRFPGDDSASNEQSITAIAFGNVEIRRLPDAEDGLMRIFLRALSTDTDETILNTTPDVCNHEPSGFIFGVDDRGIDVLDNQRGGAMYVNDVLVQMKSRAQILFEQNEIRIVHIEGEIDVTYGDEPTITLTENSQPEYAGLRFDETGAIADIYEGRLYSSDIDRLSFDPQLLYAAINFTAPDINQIAGQVIEPGSFGTFQGADSVLSNVLTFAIETSSVIPQSTSEPGVSGASNTGTEAFATTFSSTENGTRDFVDQIYFRTSPENGTVTVSVACPDDGNTDVSDCIDGGLENPTIAIFDQNSALIGTASSLTPDGFNRVDFSFEPGIDGVYTILVSGTGRPPRVFDYCISASNSTNQCPDVVPPIFDSPRIFFPPEFEPLPPQEITVGEDYIIPITVFDPNGNLSFSQPIPGVEDEDLVEIVEFTGSNNSYSLVIKGLAETEIPTNVFVTATTTIDGNELQSSLAIPLIIIGCTIPPGWISYVVQPGDTYFNLTQRIPGLTLEELYASNCIDPDNPIGLIAGDTIWLPQNPGGGTSTGIVVNTNSMATIDDGFCSLIEAINAANSNLSSGTQSGECIPGLTGASDTILLEAPGPYTLSTSVASEVGLPPITSAIIIEGNGNTIQRLSSQLFRIFEVTSSGNLTLNNVVVSGGDVRFGGANGGGVQNSGTLVVNGTITGNFAVDGGGISNLGGTVIVNGNVTNNFANINGGGILNRGIMTIYGSVSDNSANGSGGGISNSSLHDLDLIGATLNNNINGAIANSGILEIASASFSNNSPGGTPASVVINLPGSSTTFNNTTIGINSGTNCSGIGTIIVGSGNTGGDGSCF